MIRSGVLNRASACPQGRMALRNTAICGGLTHEPAAWCNRLFDPIDQQTVAAQR